MGLKKKEIQKIILFAVSEHKVEPLPTNVY